MEYKINNITFHVESGETEAALDILVELYKINKTTKLNDAIVIKVDCEENNRKYHTGLITNTEWQLKRNNINFSILSLIESSSHLSSNVNGEVPTESSKSKKKLWFITFFVGCTILAVSLFFHYQNQSNPKPSQSENIQNLIVDNLGIGIYPDYKEVYLKRNLSKKTNVIEKAKSFIQQISFFDDKQLDLNAKIYRDISITISYKILSLLSDNINEQIDYSAKGIANAENAKMLMSSIKTLQNIEEAKDIQTWADEERHESRIAVNEFILKCVNNKSGGAVTREQVIQSYNLLPSKQFLTEEGYDEYPIIKWFFQEFKQIK